MVGRRSASVLLPQTNKEKLEAAVRHGVRRPLTVWPAGRVRTILLLAILTSIFSRTQDHRNHSGACGWNTRSVSTKSPRLEAAGGHGCLRFGHP